MTKLYAIGKSIQVMEQGFLNPFPGQGKHKDVGHLGIIAALKQCGESVVVFSDFNLAIEYANLFSRESGLSKFSDYFYYPPVVEVTLFEEGNKKSVKIKSPMQTREFEGFMTDTNNLKSMEGYFYNSGWGRNPRHHHVTGLSYRVMDITKLPPEASSSKCMVM